ncbi:hypothetical protein D9756_002278 [Leucocoprinus leucothites]|uniref:DUF202 domain-containing protein n=1 Tax=Leucocoprinus leucothites TaxID=201217 RepID=A0A8H5GBR7_9AGAR|nr:hypothetical protein D9756_002278 [Leucoagaricus leucothites]
MARPNEVENAGSQARDFCMLERNFLSHVKLMLLLAILSWSVLLHARLVPEQPEETSNNGGIPLSAVEYGAALVCAGAGCWEYYEGYRDLRKLTPFLRGTNLHLTIMSVLSVVVFGTCIALVIMES